MMERSKRSVIKDLRSSFVWVEKEQDQHLIIRILSIAESEAHPGEPVPKVL